MMKNLYLPLPMLFSFLAMLNSSPAIADSVTVTNGLDLAPNAANCNFGPPTSSTCTLRKAIALTNSTTALDYIQFDVSSVTLTRAGWGDTRGDLDVRRDTIFKGPVVIQQQENDRVMQVFSNADVTLAEVTLAGGNTNGSGGGILHTGAQLTLVESKIQKCRASRGGGLYATSPTNIINTEISYNDASRNGGGIYARATVLTVADSTVSNNKAQTLGGGIVATTSIVSITDSTISKNEVGQQGGGLYTRASSTTLVDSAFTSNLSGSDGGGIWIDSASSSPTVLTGLDIIGNAADENGGGIFISGASADLTGVYADKNAAGETGGAAYFFRTTLTSEGNSWENNSAQVGGGVAVVGQGNASFNFDKFSDNSAVAQSTGVRRQGAGGALVALRDPLWWPEYTLTPDMTIGNSEFSTNTATHSGGAISGGTGGDITIQTTRLRSNSSDFYAGTISTRDYLEMTDSVVEDSFSAAGVGAINVFASAAKFQNVSFLRNVGSNSSALHLSPGAAYSTNFEIQSCYFDSNGGRQGSGTASTVVLLGNGSITDSFFSNDDGAPVSAQIEVRASSLSSLPDPTVWLNRVSVNAVDHSAVRTRDALVGIKHSSLTTTGAGDVIDQQGPMVIMYSTISALGNSNVRPWKLLAPQLVAVIGSIIDGACGSSNAANSVGHNAWLKNSSCLTGGGLSTDVQVNPGMLDLGVLSTGGPQVGAAAQTAFLLGRPRGPLTPLSDVVPNCTDTDLWGVQRANKCDAGALESF